MRRWVYPKKRFIRVAWRRRVAVWTSQLRRRSLTTGRRPARLAEDTGPARQWVGALYKPTEMLALRGGTPDDELGLYGVSIVMPPTEAKRVVNLLLAGACLFFVVCTHAWAEQSPADDLQASIQLFEEGDYVGAQHALNRVDTGGLDADGRSTHAEYTQRAELAVSMFQKAETDFEASELAHSEGRGEDARRLLRGVIDNSYAAKETRQAAEVDLLKMERRPAAAPLVGETAFAAAPIDESDPDITRQQRSLRAKVLTRDGNEALEAGQLSEAERLFRKALEQVPGYPEAKEGLERLGDHEMVESQARSLVEKYRERNAIKWQRTVATYRSAEREVRDLVLKNRFQQARQSLLRARQVVESGKIAADPVSRYEALLHDLESLTHYVADEERRFNEQEVIGQQEEARREHADRSRQRRENKLERVNALMNEALQHRKDRDYESAINVLRQVSAIDPTNDNARWLREVIEDQQAFSVQRDIHDEISKQTQNVLIDLQRSRVPWWQEVTYPKNWLEIISRETRRIPGSEATGGIDPDLQSKLDTPIRIDFHGDPFETVVERLADAHGVNISVAWGDLAAAAIDPQAPVRLKLSNPVPMRTALREVLDQVSGGHAELGFLPTGGVVKIATRDFLDRQTFEEVYDVKDLLMPIPDFNDAPNMDLANASIMRGSGDPSLRRSEEAMEMYPSGYGEGSEEAIEEDANELVTLIRRTIRPDSWLFNNGSGCSISEINGQLVITQTPTGHARIGGLLSKLREQRAIQVAVEARFITVQSNYLEEMGMDLDVVLNAGNAGFDFLENPDQRGGLLLDPLTGSRLLLPRSLSRFGFTPATPTGGNTLTTGTGSGAGLIQPFNEPGLVPQRGNSITSGSSATPIPLINNILQLTDPSGLTSDLPGSFAGNPGLQPAFSLFGSFLDNIQVDFLIRATQADSRTSLLTAPRLVLFNGQRAWVAVVNQQSFVSALTPVVDAAGAAPTVSTIETGAVLDAQVTVSADKRYVTMTLRPSVGRLLGIQTFPFLTGANAGEGSFVQLPNISRQVLRTTVTVPDGGTLLIGGQKLAGEIEVESGVPILSKIPIFKRLYSSRTLVKDEQILLILIKPKIIIQSEAEQEAFPTFSQR